MAVLGQETTAFKEGEGMGNNAMPFVVGSGGGGNGLIQDLQGQQWLIAAQVHGAQRAGLIK